jgi:hypothetical protein
MDIFVYGFECVTKIKYLMEYLLKISSIGNEEERQEQVNGTLPDVYQYMRENCKVGEVADIYGENEYIETAIRLGGSVATLTHKIEW